MKRLVLLAALTLGCAHAPALIRISVSAGRFICSGLGCPCETAGPMAHPGAPVGFDVYPDGGVRAVYR